MLVAGSPNSSPDRTLSISRQQYKGPEKEYVYLIFKELTPAGLE
jgi:hypothetical protein